MQYKKRITENLHRQQGLGIVEVLVALVVVSFGVLGMASLQLTGMKHSTGGFNRSKALMYAENIATRMRVNETGVDKLFYADYDSNDTICSTLPAQLCQATPGNPAPGECSDEQLAEFDLYSVACGDVGISEANDGVVAALPSGRLTVSCDDTIAACDEDSTHTITVTWQEGSVSSDDKTAQVNRRVQVRLQP